MKDEMLSGEIGFVLLHGAGLGGWIWSRVIKRLEYPSIAVDYPGRGHNAHMSTKTMTLHHYVESAQSDLKRFAPEKIIIVAHSISGVLGLELAHLNQSRMAGYIGVGAAVPRGNGSFLSSLPKPSGFIMQAILTIFGTKPPASAVRNGLCSDLDEAAAREVESQFVAESKRLYTDKLHHRGTLPHALYIRLSEDREFTEAVQQRMIANLQPDETASLSSGHLPMLSKPDELANMLNQYAAARMNQAEPKINFQ